MENSWPAFASLGDASLVVLWENRIDRQINRKVIALETTIREHPFTGLIDLVPAYNSLTVLYDPVQIKSKMGNKELAASFVKARVQLALDQLTTVTPGETSQEIEIPVCYDQSLGNDLQAISDFSGLPVNKVMELHYSREYYVYMSGFLPGFVYMGEVAGEIAIARKQQPVPVKTGAVGIAGRQTGVYPVASPGGWHLVGYTPLPMFNPQTSHPCLLKAGDTVRFTPIDLAKYEALKRPVTP